MQFKFTRSPYTPCGLSSRGPHSHLAPRRVPSAACPQPRALSRVPSAACLRSRRVAGKTILWDYEYTLFEASTDPYKVFDTDIGRLGLLICADGILPETARCLAVMGAQACHSRIRTFAQISLRARSDLAQISLRPRPSRSRQHPPTLCVRTLRRSLRSTTP